MHDLSWLSGLTSLWLLLTNLEGMLCALLPDGACFFGMAAVEWLSASALAGIWLFSVIQHGQQLSGFWGQSANESRTEILVAVLGYLSICVTGMLFLNAVWTFQAACTALMNRDVGFWQVAFHNVNELGDLGSELQLVDVTADDLEAGLVADLPEKSAVMI